MSEIPAKDVVDYPKDCWEFADSGKYLGTFVEENSNMITFYNNIQKNNRNVLKSRKIRKINCLPESLTFGDKIVAKNIIEYIRHPPVFWSSKDGYLGEKLPQTNFGDEIMFEHGSVHENDTITCVPKNKDATMLNVESISTAEPKYTNESIPIARSRFYNSDDLPYVDTYGEPYIQDATKFGGTRKKKKVKKTKKKVKRTKKKNNGIV